MRCLILCGGSGTRLWPLSRQNFPKQFLNLNICDNRSLLQDAFWRAQKITEPQNIFLVTNKKHYFNAYNQVKEIFPEFSPQNILVEPASLNTAPAITYAVKFLVEKRNVLPQEPLVFFPADHFFPEPEKLISLLQQAPQQVKEKIGTIGVVPQKPHTGYGYILKGASQGENVFSVKGFFEKPDKKQAEKFFSSGQYLWNTGIYFFTAQTFAQEAKKNAPALFRFLNSGEKNLQEEFLRLEPISFDYAISEKSSRLVVFAADFAWSDVGSFDELAAIAPPNKNQINLEAKNVFAHSAQEKLIAAVGVEDLVIIENYDSLLVYRRGQGEKVKELTKILAQKHYPHLDNNVIVHKPWGKYEVLVEGKNHKVKKITVYPGERLSLQSHYHRAEHWIVVHGVAQVRRGDEENFLTENQSIFIPANTLHSLANPGKINLELIEVQTGNYLGEDDIRRWEDKYDR